MSLSALAGKTAPGSLLVNLVRLERAYFDTIPDLSNPANRVSFGTSGHRGSSLNGTFTQSHILAITQAICDYRRSKNITGPLCLGRDTHALPSFAAHTALEVLAGNSVEVLIQEKDLPTPTPVISHAILARNRGRTTGLSDGIVITPSHNPPEDGGFKYNPTNGGPADTDVTRVIQDRANELLLAGNREVKRISYEQALRAPTTHQVDFLMPYVLDLKNVIDMDAIRAAGLRIAVDPLGGASLPYWEPINKTYGLNIEVVNPALDPTFSFMKVDHDGKIRMDCSSPYAMAGLVRLKDKYQVAFANDPDADRHGIVTPSMGLMNPNYFLAVAIHYLITHRPQWSPQAKVGKSLVSSGMIDRVVSGLNRQLCEMPVGFKWLAPGLFDGSLCFGGEESAGASFLRRDGSVWTTDKDGLLLGLLAGELTAVTGKDPGVYYHELTAQYGTPYSTRIDAAVTFEQRTRLGHISPQDIKESTLAGEPITAKLTTAPGNGAPIGGLKVTTQNGSFAIRPSGTENISKLYAESFLSEQHLQQIVAEAQQLVANAIGV